MATHFLDTSILRPLIAASSHYKEYLNKELTEKKYVAEYVKMEFVRGFLIPSMSFYSLLKLPNVKSITDALLVWNNKFSGREVKSVNNMMSNLLKNKSLDYNLYNDKELASKYVGDYIRRIYSKVMLMNNAGTVGKMCTRILEQFKYDPIDLQNSFETYEMLFNDKDHASRCDLSKFLAKNKSNIENLIQNNNLKIKGSNRSGFKDLLEELQRKSYTCNQCGKIGDAIIGLLSPENMRLEHLDNSFDYIMQVLEKDHKKHQSELSYTTSQ